MKPFPIRTLSTVLVVTGSLASAWAGTLTFDELPSQPVHGLGTQGVAFTFEVGGSPSADATYNVDPGLGTTAALDGSVLEGDASGQLRLQFSTPTPNLAFGVGLLAGVDLSPGVVVNLYDSSNVLLDSIALPTVGNAGLGISEAVFSWLGSPIASAWIDFEDQAGRFALDNLTFTSGREPIPEPGTVLAGVSVGTAALMQWIRRRRASKAPLAG